MIALLTLGTIFQITMTTSNSILLGMGKSRTSMFYVMIGILVKLIASVILSQFLGIYGIIIATGLCFIIITILNLRLLKSVVPFQILGASWGSYLISVLVAGCIGLALNILGLMLTDIMTTRVAYLLTCLIVAGGIILVYLLLLIILRVLNLKELESYPLGVQQLLKPLMKLQFGRSKR